MHENLHISGNSRTFAPAKQETSCVLHGKYRGVEQLVARQAHNLEVACSSLASATTEVRFYRTFFVFYGRLFTCSRSQFFAERSVPLGLTRVLAK